jgi:phenazine biosynthesis protein phzE
VPVGVTAVGAAEVAADASTGDVYALRGPGFASIQGHLESILSRDGMTTLERLVSTALAPVRV